MTEPTHAEILSEVALLRRQLKAVTKRDAAQDKVLKDISASLSCLPKLQADVAKMRPIVEGLETAHRLSKFIKWAGGIVIAITAIAVAIREGVAHVFK